MYYYVTKKYPNDKPIKSMKSIPKSYTKAFRYKEYSIIRFKASLVGRLSIRRFHKKN